MTSKLFSLDEVRSSPRMYPFQAQCIADNAHVGRLASSSIGAGLNRAPAVISLRKLFQRLSAARPFQIRSQGIRTNIGN